MALWQPWPNRAEPLASLLKKQFQRTILGPLLIPASATPGGPSRFWLGRCLASLDEPGASGKQFGVSTLEWNSTLPLQCAKCASLEPVDKPPRATRTSLIIDDEFSSVEVEKLLSMMNFRQHRLEPGITPLNAARNRPHEGREWTGTRGRWRYPENSASFRQRAGPSHCSSLPNLQDQGLQLDTNQAPRRRGSMSSASPSHHIPSVAFLVVPVSVGSARAGRSQSRSSDAQLLPASLAPFDELSIDPAPQAR
jgi:hypothetical protein